MALKWVEGFLPQTSLETAKTYLSTISPAQWCQIYFALTAAGVLVTAVVPREFRSLLADYGARKTSSSSSSKGSSPRKKDPLLTLLAALTSLGQVPHAWFSAFYTLSVFCSLFWGGQFLVNGSVLRTIAEAQAKTGAPSATLGQVGAAWGMMLLQGLRRVYEHWFVMKASKGSTIWWVHWVLGLGFYGVVSMAVWVEGGDAIIKGMDGWVGDVEGWVKVGIALPAYLFAWVNQYRCHRHLAGLKKYSLPSEGMFRWFVSPHYTCECLLYLSLAIAAAPRGEMINKTMLAVLGFVLVNLGETAAGTRQWYSAKFGADKIARRWNMIPFVF